MPANVKHGRWLASGKLPPGCGSIQKALAALRNKLTAAIDSQRTRTIVDELNVQTVARFEAIAQLWARWLAEKTAELTIEQRLAVTQKIITATEARDRAVAALRLNELGNGNTLEALVKKARENAAGHSA